MFTERKYTTNDSNFEITKKGSQIVHFLFVCYNCTHTSNPKLFVELYKRTFLY